jgi:hypothetical protein
MGFFNKKKKMEEEKVCIWEPIDDYSDRLKVPGGWIVASYIVIDRYKGASVSIHQVFVADPSHEWQLEDSANQKNSQRVIK